MWSVGRHQDIEYCRDSIQHCKLDNSLHHYRSHNYQDKPDKMYLTHNSHLGNQSSRHRQSDRVGIPQQGRRGRLWKMFPGR